MMHSFPAMRSGYRKVERSKARNMRHTARRENGLSHTAACGRPGEIASAGADKFSGDATKSYSLTMPRRVAFLEYKDENPCKTRRVRVPIDVGGERDPREEWGRRGVQVR
jgi:hypothetical protein